MSSGPRSLHVVSSLSLASGGPTESVPQLCEHLNRLGAPAEIATLSSIDDRDWEGLTLIHRHPLGLPAKLRRSSALSDFLMRETSRFDIIHVHGLWEWPGYYAREAATRHHRPLIISPRGMLEPWAMAHHKWFKRLALRLWESKNLQSAALLHATSDQEAYSLRAEGAARVEVIPNGIDAPSLVPVRGPSIPRRLLFLSRYHEKKGIPLLLEAWKDLHTAFPQWLLELHGPDTDGYRARMEALARSFGIPESSIRFHGPAHGQAKWDLLSEADLFVLPTHSENFGNVVAESLSQGTPVVTTHGAPWSDLVSEGCGWWIPVDVRALTETLAQALALPHAELRAMGGKGAAWARAAFHWTSVAERMARTYQSLLLNDV